MDRVETDPLFLVKEKINRGALMPAYYRVICVAVRGVERMRSEGEMIEERKSRCGWERTLSHVFFAG
jgi:hypothetical protein